MTSPRLCARTMNAWPTGLDLKIACGARIGEGNSGAWITLLACHVTKRQNRK